MTADEYDIIVASGGAAGSNAAATTLRERLDTGGAADGGQTDCRPARRLRSGESSPEVTP